MPEATDEWDKLVASAEQAAARGELGSAFELIWTTRRFANYRGGFDVVSWAAPMTQRPDAMAAPAFAEAAALVAVGLTRRGEYGAAEVLVDRALLAPTERPDEVGFRASMVRGFIESGDRRDVPASLPHYRNTLSFALSPADEAIRCANLSSLLSDIEPAEASVHASRATDLLERHDVPSSQRALVLALLALGAADPEEVRRFADEAVELADRVGATWPGGLARGSCSAWPYCTTRPSTHLPCCARCSPTCTRAGS